MSRPSQIFSNAILAAANWPRSEAECIGTLRNAVGLAVPLATIADVIAYVPTSSDFKAKANEQRQPA